MTASFITECKRLSSVLCNIFGLPVNKELYYGQPVRDVHSSYGMACGGMAYNFNNICSVSMVTAYRNTGDH